jgi:hypothetical protein
MFRKLLLPSLLLCASTGCADNLDAVLRDAHNNKSEAIDVLMKINDEEDAKLVKEKLLAKAKAHFDFVVKERFDKWEKGFGTRRITDIALEYAKLKQEPLKLLDFNEKVFAKAMEKIKKDDRPEMQAVFDSFIEYYKSNAAANTRLDAAVSRLGRLVDKFTQEKIAELRAQGVEDPKVNPKDHWPTLESVRTFGTPKADLLGKEIELIQKMGVELSGFRSGVGMAPMGVGGPGGGLPGGGLPGGGPPDGFPEKQ